MKVKSGKRPTHAFLYIYIPFSACYIIRNMGDTARLRQKKQDNKMSTSIEIARRWDSPRLVSIETR